MWNEKHLIPPDTQKGTKNKRKLVKLDQSKGKALESNVSPFNPLAFL
jgi:hypothetical protein